MEKERLRVARPPVTAELWLVFSWQRRATFCCWLINLLCKSFHCKCDTATSWPQRWPSRSEPVRGGVSMALFDQSCYFLDEQLRGHILQHGAAGARARPAKEHQGKVPRAPSLGRQGESPSKAQPLPSTANTLLLWGPAQLPDRNPTQPCPKASRQQLRVVKTFTELSLTCTGFTLCQLKDDSK